MKQIIPYLTLAAVIAGIAVALWSSQQAPRVAFVRSNDLVYGYLGMQEAIEVFQRKQAIMTRDLDSLDLNYRRAEDHARSFGPKDGNAQAQEAARHAREKRMELQRMHESVQLRIQEEEKTMLAGVLSQVNSFTARYAKEHGYDMILGTTDDGAVLFGKPELDITVDLLAALNEDHKGAAQ